MTKVRIFVTYKQSVFDPQGETIKDDVQVGKFFDVTVDGTGDAVEKTVKEIADQLLVNFNMETYTYQVMEEE